MSKNLHQMVQIDRRQALKAAGAGVLAMGFAGVANATPEATTEAIGKLGTSGTANSGKISIKLPELAENAASVTLTVSVDSPMTDADHVKQIHVFAEQNPSPEVVTFNLTPTNGKAEVTTRMRVAKTQNIVIAAVMNDGSVHTNQKEVKVTIGGCGG